MLLIYLLSFLPLALTINNTNITGTQALTATPALSATPSLITTYSSKHTSTLQVSSSSLPSLPLLSSLSSQMPSLPSPSQSELQSSPMLNSSISPSESVSLMPQLSPSPSVSSQSTQSALPKPNIPTQQTEFYNTQSFQIGFPVGLVSLFIIVCLLGHYMTPNPPQKSLTQFPVVNPIQPRPDYIIENGLKYYYDGPGGKLLAYGWKRVTDNVDVWYDSSIGKEPSWTPVYK